MVFRKFRDDIRSRSDPAEYLGYDKPEPMPHRYDDGCCTRTHVPFLLGRVEIAEARPEAVPESARLSSAPMLTVGAFLYSFPNVESRLLKCAGLAARQVTQPVFRVALSTALDRQGAVQFSHSL